MLNSLPKYLLYTNSTHYLKSCEMLLLCTMYYMPPVEIPVTLGKTFSNH